jgi:two-component system sensor histidine kinase HydH
MKRYTFNLRLWFALGSFGSIAVICVISAYWVSSFVTRSLLERESEVSQEFMESIVRVDGSAMFNDDGSAPQVPSAALLDFARHIVSMPGVFRVNIHAPTHRILWSTEKQLVGQKFERNAELDEAFRGQRVTEIGTLPDESKPEHVALGRLGHFIEAYIPIRAEGGRGPVLGVVEFYKHPLALNETIRLGQRIVWTAAAFAALVLFLTLYWIVQRGARLIEQQQRHLSEMEALAAIGQMSGAVAHSLRNPMSAIRSSAELWRSELPDGKCEVVDEVIQEVDRMDGYVRDLLAYARSEPYQLHPVDPLNALDTVITKHRAAIERYRIEPVIVDKRDGPRKVLADGRLLEQALTSIVTNAIEAMPEGGKLTLSVEAREKDRLAITIADTGRGIPAEILERVAQSYFTTKARGLGLGLVLAKGVIERFQGKLQIASTRDLGTTVCIDLKAA